jgi:single-stranded DNA-binding protein
MSAFVLVSGTLSRAPELKTSKSGKPYVTATIKVAADNATEFWSALAFSEIAHAELMRLVEGDKVSVQGSLKVEPYTGRDGQTRINRTVFADHVLALRQPPRERKSRASASSAPDGVSQGPSNDGGPNDAIPF